MPIVDKHTHTHIHLHVDFGPALDKIDLLQKTVENMAKTVDTMREILTEINNSTNNIAADLERLANQAEGGLTPDEATDFVTELRSTAAQLKAVADKNPEPAEPGAPEPTPEA